MNRNTRREALNLKRGGEDARLGRIASGNHLTAQNDEPEVWAVKYKPSGRICGIEEDGVCRDVYRTRQAAQEQADSPIFPSHYEAVPLPPGIPYQFIGDAEAQPALSADGHNLAAEWTGLSEEDLQLGDVQRSVDKARRFHERNDRAAFDLQRALDQRRGSR